MKVKLNSLLDDASGKFGDNVFARNPSGLYLRKNTLADQPNSERQISIRDRFSIFAARWATLTEEQRVGWNSLARQITKAGKYGDLYNPSGHQLYIALNTTRGEFALAALDDAPFAPEALPAVLDFAPALSLDGTGALVLQLGPATAIGSRGLVFATEPMSAGRSVVSESSYRLITTVAVGDLLSLSLGEAYEGKFGTPASGVKVGVKLIPVSVSGFQGTPQSSLVIVTA
jgi:hypothetical protein